MWKWLLGILPNPYVILGVGMVWLSSCAYSAYLGYQYADRSAEISELERQKKAAADTISRLEQQAIDNRGIADRAAQRAHDDDVAMRELREKINVLLATEESKPADSICRIDDATYIGLSDLARAANGTKSNPAKLPSKPRTR